MIEQIQRFAEQHPFWNWTAIIGSALASWLAPIASLVAITLGCIQGYIAIQKYRHWKKTQGKR